MKTVLMIYAAAASILGIMMMIQVIRRSGGILYLLLGICLAVGLAAHVLSAIGLGLGGGAVWIYGLVGSAAEAAICWISFQRLCWPPDSQERKG
jgi:hypothetical protein